LLFVLSFLNIFANPYLITNNCRAVLIHSGIAVASGSNF